MADRPITPYREEMRARAEQWIPAMLAREPTITSADKAYAYLRDTGLYVPRQDVRYVWAEYGRGRNYIEIINRLPEQERIPRAWMEDTAFQYGSKYNYIVEVTGRDWYTDELWTDTYTVASTTNLTIEEILAGADYAAFASGYLIVDPAQVPQILHAKYNDEGIGQ